MAKYHTTTSGFIDVIEKCASKDLTLRSAWTKEMRIFINAKGDFGRITVVSDRAVTLPEEWWITYGSTAPNLQKLAVRVLGQTCSASGCERNWSLFERVHSKKRNRLEHQRMCDIVYVHCNQRLQQRSKWFSRNYDPISLEDIGNFDKNWIIEENPLGLNAEEIDTFRKELAANKLHCNYNEEELVSVDEADLVEDDGNSEDGNAPSRSRSIQDHALFSGDVGKPNESNNDQWDNNLADWNFSHV